MTNLKVKKVPGTKSRGVFGPALINGNIDNTFKVLAKLYAKQGGEYRLTPYKHSPEPICEFVNNDKYYVPDFVKVSNFTQPMPCPVPKVNHLCIFVVLLQVFFFRLLTQSTVTF
jgi:hypothetical protein